ncbi:hypothetical protein NQT69_15635 [Pseudoalteromonas shioyasakiensis]|nr:hypothetical protein [Pseudoalteromonas shioyasakiensis]
MARSSLSEARTQIYIGIEIEFINKEQGAVGYRKQKSYLRC